MAVSLIELEQMVEAGTTLHPHLVEKVEDRIEREDKKGKRENHKAAKHRHNAWRLREVLRKNEQRKSLTKPDSGGIL